MTQAGKRLAHGALAALLLAAPVAARGPSRARGADAQALFEALRLQPATSGVELGLTPAQAAQMNAIITRSYARGATVADWRNRGVSMSALTAARPGGAAAQMFAGTTPFGPHRIYPGDAPIGSLIPAHWVLVGRYGERREDGLIQIEIARISPKIVVVARIGREEVGNAVCRLHAQALFYADPAVPASEDDVIALRFQFRVLPEMQRQALCTVFEERARGAYGTRYFDRSGRRVPQLDARSTTFRIAPRAPFPAHAGRRTDRR